MQLIGITGGIGSGKSTAMQLLATLYPGIPQIDADKLARQVVAPHTAGLAAVLTAFPECARTVDGVRTIDRDRLGAIVFADEPSRRRLNAIVHPRVRWEMLKAVLSCWVRGHRRVILDIPLLFESHLDRWMSVTVVIFCDEATQVVRLMARSQMSEAAARTRIAVQTPLAQKCQLADIVVDNCGDAEELRRNLVAAFATRPELAPPSCRRHVAIAGILLLAAVLLVYLHRHA